MSMSSRREPATILGEGNHRTGYVSSVGVRGVRASVRSTLHVDREASSTSEGDGHKDHKLQGGVIADTEVAGAATVDGRSGDTRE